VPNERGVFVVRQWSASLRMMDEVVCEKRQSISAIVLSVDPAIAAPDHF
jgi:hypothetical protein